MLAEDSATIDEGSVETKNTADLAPVACHGDETPTKNFKKRSLSVAQNA